MKNAKTFAVAKAEAHKLLKGKILVGHSLKHDFEVLEWKSEDKDKIRDISKYRKY
jgi:hypothetical protein